MGKVENVLEQEVSVQEKLLRIEADLNSRFYEREEVIRGLLLALLAREHIVLLGPPGTGKSALVEELCQRIGGGYFRWLLSATSTPEDVFGPISLSGLEHDRYERVTAGKLPMADIAFLDEIFKCNSAVLNGMLSILNERLFFNGGTPTNVPLQMVVGASNEMPHDREELGALWDRFILRYKVDYLRSPGNIASMVLGGNTTDSGTTISLHELATMQEEVGRVHVSDEFVFTLISVRNALEGIGVSISDRRFKTAVKIAQASAYLNQEDEVADEDIEALSACFWLEPEQIAQVKKEILKITAPADQEVLDIIDEIYEVRQTAMDAPEAEKARAGSEANAKIKKASTRIETLMKEAEMNGRSTRRMKEALTTISTMQKEVLAHCLGVSL